MATAEHHHFVDSLPVGERRASLRASNIPQLSKLAWIGFALQLLAIAGLELGDDIFRGNIDPPNAREAVQHAQQLVHFEQIHGIFVEPAVQLWLRHSHALFGLLSYGSVVNLANLIYALAQTLVPVVIAGWIFLKHRSRFPLVRNIALLATFLAVVGYELFPLAPPRLTTGLAYNHHAFRFQDAMQDLLSSKSGGSALAYNPYSAMPSLHMVWAIILAGCVLFLSRRLLIRVLACLYPIIMLFTIVVTGNHFLLDAAGALAVVAIAVPIAYALEAVRRRFHQARRSRPIELDGRHGLQPLPASAPCGRC